jgi:hypothetical protein
MSTALRLEGHKAWFEAVSGISGKQERAVGIRTRCQAQLEEGEDVVKREPGEDDEALVKEEKDVDDDLESDLTRY